MPLLQWRGDSSEQEHLLVETSFQSDDHFGDDGDIELQENVDHSVIRPLTLLNLDYLEEEGNHPKDEKWKMYQGLLFSCMSSLFFSLCSVIVKYLYHIHPGELACLRFLGILVFTLPMVIHNQENPLGPRNLRHLLILRGIVGSASLFLRFCAMHYLPIADANVIIFSVPVFVSLFARVFLKEPCGIIHVFTIILTLLGLALVTKLPMIFADSESILTFKNNDHIYGVAAALTSTVFSASVYIVVRKVKGVHHSIIMFNFGWVSIIETTLLTTALNGFSLPHCGFDQWLIVLLGLFSFAGQIMLTRSLQLEQAGPVSVVRAAADIVFVFIWQIIFFEEIPDGYSISGALLVTSSVILTSVKKWVMSLPESSRFRRAFYFLTL